MGRRSVLARVVRLFKVRCPRCDGGRLTTETFIRATCKDAQGRRYPAAFAFFACDTCESQWKRHVGAELEPADPADWARFVPPK